MISFEDDIFEYFSASSSSASNKKLKSSSCSDGEDRINDLSDNILHHILSFLNMEQAVQTSVLSRRWRFLWSSLPFLKFDWDLYHSRLKKGPNSLNTFVDKVLLQRDNSNIQRFNLQCGSENHLNTWILNALRFNLQELRISVAIVDGLFRLPHRLFTCTSLTVLKLHNYADWYCVKLSLPDSISLPVLRKLSIQRISFEGRDDLVNKLISGCLLLESLSIRHCKFHPNYIRISSLKLKHLKIEKYYDGSVMLCAPNLISFRYKDFLLKIYLLGEFPSLVKADIDIAIDGKSYQELPAKLKKMYLLRMMHFITVVQKVKALTLSGSVLQILSKAYVLQQTSSAQFCNLRRLELVTRLSVDCIPGITYVLKMCPNIEALSLMINLDLANIRDDSEARLSSEWLLHHLKRVEFQSFSGCVNELKFLEVVLKHSPVLEKLSITASEFASSKQKRLWRDKLLTFPIASPCIAIVLV